MKYMYVRLLPVMVDIYLVGEAWSVAPSLYSLPAILVNLSPLALTAVSITSTLCLSVGNMMSRALYLYRATCTTSRTQYFSSEYHGMLVCMDIIATCACCLFGLL